MTRKSIMLLRKFLLITESRVSKCGYHIVKKIRDVLYPKRTKYSKYRKGRYSRGCEPDGTQLGFGRYGTQSCRAGRLSYRAIEAARRATIGQFRRPPAAKPVSLAHYSRVFMLLLLLIINIKSGNNIAFCCDGSTDLDRLRSSRSGGARIID